MTITRRDFLKIANRALLTASGLLGFGALLRFFGYQSEAPAPTEFDLGLGENYPLGSSTLLEEIPAILHHTEAGFTALSLTCTHLGCTLEQDDKNLSCPCHGSRFDTEGAVLQGPAKEHLSEYRIETREDGHLILHFF